MASETAAQVVNKTTSDKPTSAEEQDAIKNRRRKLMFSAILAGVALALIAGYFLNRPPTPPPAKKSMQELMARQRATEEKQYAQTFDRSGDVVNPTTHTTKESPQTLLELADRAKKAGLVVMGVSQCGWTRRQREMFGGADSKARKVLESIYIECRNRDMCPNVRGYPTWVRGDQQYPGFMDATKLRTIINAVESLPDQPMLQEPSEPTEVNMEEELPAALAAPNPLAIKAAENVAQASAAVAEAAVRQKRVDLPSSDEPGHAETNGTKENVRGVSNYPPLNVPDMPGTAPWALNQSHATNQFQQGNLPRQALSNPDPVVELARQMASTFQQIAHDAGRDPGAASYANARMPQSANITTGDPLDDKRVYTEKN